MKEWLVAHPAVLNAAMTLIVWPVLTALVTLVFDASDEQLAKLPKWVAVPLRFMRAAGIDTREVIAVLKDAFTKEPPAPPAGG